MSGATLESWFTSNNPMTSEVSRCSFHLNQVEDDPFLLLKEGHCFCENTLSVCNRTRLQPNVVFESGQFATILAMVAAGTGISVVSEMAIEPRTGCRFIALVDESADRRIGIVQLKRHFRSRIYRAFLGHLRHNKKSNSVNARNSLAA